MDTHYGFLMLKYATPYMIETLHRDIDPNDVYKIDDKDYGLEKETHVTLAPCLDNNITVVELKRFLNPINSYSASVSELSMFECDDYDVLKYDVTCQALKDTNAKIGMYYKMHTEHKYHPHMTVAYMKKGCAKKYLLPRYKFFPTLYMIPKNFIWSYYDTADEQQRINFL